MISAGVRIRAVSRKMSAVSHQPSSFRPLDLSAVDDYSDVGAKGLEVKVMISNCASGILRRNQGEE